MAGADSYSYFSTPSSPTSSSSSRPHFNTNTGSRATPNTPTSSYSTSTIIASNPSTTPSSANPSASSASSALTTDYVYSSVSLRSDTHTFSVPEFDCYRLYALLASCASSSDWQLLLLLTHFIPLSQETEAAESLLPVQVFSGIPRTIEACALLRQSLDERKNKDRQWLMQLRQESLAIIVNKCIRDQSIWKLLQRLATYDHILSARHARSLTQRQPSLPPLDASYPPVCPTCKDNNSTSIRMHRGRQTLNVVYGAATAEKLLSALAHSNLALEQSVQQHIYGHVLCTPILSVQAIELISIACLTYVKTHRQVFSHVRGALMNGVTRSMCERVLLDVESVFRHADKTDPLLAPSLPYVDETRRLIVKIDEKINPAHYTKQRANL